MSSGKGFEVWLSVGRSHTWSIRSMKEEALSCLPRGSTSGGSSSGHACAHITFALLMASMRCQSRAASDVAVSDVAYE